MTDKKHSDVLTEPAPDDAPPEELNGEVVDVTTIAGLPAVPDLADDEKLHNAIGVAARFFEFTDAVKKLALARTKPHHWAKYPRGEGGFIYYLTGDGATNLIKGFGIQILEQRGEKFWGEDELGRYYFYVFTGIAYVPIFNMRVEGIEGRCSQRKAFFAKAGNEWKPTSEIDEMYIRGDAQTDFFRNVIRRTIGIGYETEETIAEAKIDTSKVAAPKFKKGGQSGSGVIKAKWNSKCTACGKSIPKGADMYYDRPNKKAYHPECAPSNGGEEETAGPAEETPAAEAPSTPAAEDAQRTNLVSAIKESAKTLGMTQPQLEKTKADVWGKLKSVDDATLDELGKLYSSLVDMENAAAEKGMA